MIHDHDVSYEQAVAIFGEATVEAALLFHRHREHEDGAIYWPKGADLEEAVELAEIEQNQEWSDCS
jgi:hypothetical protein